MKLNRTPWPFMSGYDTSKKGTPNENQGSSKSICKQETPYRG